MRFSTVHPRAALCYTAARNIGDEVGEMGNQGYKFDAGSDAATRFERLGRRSLLLGVTSGALVAAIVIAVSILLRAKGIG